MARKKENYYLFDILFRYCILHRVSLQSSFWCWEKETEVGHCYTFFIFYKYFKNCLDLVLFSYRGLGFLCLYQQSKNEWRFLLLMPLSYSWKVFLLLNTISRVLHYSIAVFKPSFSFPVVSQSSFCYLFIQKEVDAQVPAIM